MSSTKCFLGPLYRFIDRIEISASGIDWGDYPNFRIDLLDLLLPFLRSRLYLESLKIVLLLIRHGASTDILGLQFSWLCSFFLVHLQITVELKMFCRSHLESSALDEYGFTYFLLMAIFYWTHHSSIYCLFGYFSS